MEVAGYFETLVTTYKTTRYHSLEHNNLKKILCLYFDLKSWDSAVGIATGYEAGRERGQSLSFGRVKNFLFSMSSRPTLGSTQPPIQWVSGALSPGVKRPVREADHSPPTSGKVKKMWIYTSTTPYAFMV
jgi:hypothetical protein